MREFIKVWVLTASFSLSVFAALDTFNLNEHYLMKQWTTEQGLPQNNVTDILQTKDRFIWFTTLAGIAKFDGVKFTTFSSSNTPALKDNRFISVSEDFENNLWINSEYGNIYLFKNGEFYHIAVPNNAKLNRFAHRDSDGGVWIQGDNKLRKYYLNGSVISDAFTKEISIAETKNTFYAGLLFLGNEVWFVNENHQLVRKSLVTGERLQNPNGTSGETMLFVGGDNVDDGFWVVSETDVHRIVNGNIVKTFAKNSDFKKSEEDCRKVYYVRNGELWYLSDTKLYKYSANSVEKIDVPQIEGFNPTRIEIDTENSVWIGTTTNGLIHLTENQIRTYGRVMVKNLAPTYSVVEDKNGKVWIGSLGLLSVYDKKLNFEWNSNHDKLDKLKEVNTIATDNNGNIVFAVENRLYRIINGKVQLINQFDTDDYPQTISILFVDRDDNFWIGRNNSLRILKGSELSSYSIAKAPNNGLSGEWIQAITQLKNGDVWVGTIDGVRRFRNTEILNFPIGTAIPMKEIRDIFEDDEGTVWLGTYGNGIYRYKDDKFVQITAVNGLAENISTAIVSDNFDNLWILGNRGVYSISRKMLNDFADGKIPSVIALVHNTSDGMITDEGNGINQYSGWKAKDGTIWFTMVQGVIAIKPQADSAIAPNVYIEKVRSKNQQINFKTDLEFGYDEGNVEIDYTGLSFRKSEDIQFRYMLEGLDKHWQLVGKRRTAYFSSIPPGNYSFKVEAMSADGVWSKTSASINIRVAAPFWKTWWFNSAIVLLVLCFGLSVQKYRLYRIELANIRQQEFSKQLIDAHEDERKRIASDLHDGLGQDLLIIKNWVSIARKKIEPDKKDEMLANISDLTTKAIEETRTISSNLMPLHLKRFGLSGTLKHMAQNLQRSTEINIEYEVDVIDNLVSKTAEMSIYRVIQEALNNIVKHSKATSALIKIKRYEKMLKISVRDNGKGFFVPRDIELDSHSTGLGLNNMIQRIKLIHGRISINSFPTKGTSIEIEVDLNQSTIA